MNLALMLLWAADGWCGTPWRRHWPGPGPDPEPWWVRLVGAVGGIIGGWVFSAVWPAGPDISMALYAGATSVGAFVGSAIVQDIAGLAMGNKARV
jgi:hypothetical protein